ncbi:hypothetical protein NC653_039927 [Populus alba x Populus x berolinensis]|uniref:Uncharacterized protein n=1 Tax=Populus alba x Populus x berolinensis TaxID=444605 RepID=A0AAD6PRZ7_9ROSI|nr:hypothetical protein NC653_039927 [Populus alba x Populus x berolinensis]
MEVSTRKLTTKDNQSTVETSTVTVEDQFSDLPEKCISGQQKFVQKETVKHMVSLLCQDCIVNYHYMIISARRCTSRVKSVSCQFQKANYLNSLSIRSTTVDYPPECSFNCYFLSWLFLVDLSVSIMAPSPALNCTLKFTARLLLVYNC